jgi:hypothetical protein
MIRFAQLHRELPPRALTREPIKMTDHQQQPNDGQSHSSGIKTVTIRLDDTPIAAVTLLTDFSPRIARMHLIAETTKAIKSKEFTAVLTQIGLSK